MAELAPEALAALAEAAGPGGAETDSDLIAPRLVDWRGRRRGTATLLLRPSGVADVVAIVRAAAAHRVALVPQGGLTGLVGGALPEPGRASALLDLSRLAAIRALDVPGRVLVAEAGVTLDRVHQAAAAAALRFPLSLAARGSATIGGLVATNAGGTQVLRHGTMRRLTLGLEAVLPSGELLALGALRKDNTGLDIKQLLIGAEGTLGIVTAAALALAPAMRARTVAWAGVPSPAAALTLLASLGADVESFELVPADGLALVLAYLGARAPLASPHAWHALIEIEAEPDAVAAPLLAHAAEAVVATTGAQADALWALREALPDAERRDGPALKHDIALPVAAVPAFLAEVTPELEAAFPGARVLAFGHLGDGNLHYNVRAPVRDAATWLAANGEPVTARVHDHVVARGGSISAEHGVGVFKVAEWARLGDPAKRAAARAIKDALDPLGIMNPGKLF